jgi:hypothetical protein
VAFAASYGTPRRNACPNTLSRGVEARPIALA